jgi:hypothetical protein
MMQRLCDVPELGWQDNSAASMHSPNPHYAGLVAECLAEPFPTELNLPDGITRSQCYRASSITSPVPVARGNWR